MDKGMDGTAKFQVTAQADGKIVKASLHGTDGEQISECLGRVLMAAVAGIDDGDAGSLGCYQRGALFGMAHGADICVTGNHADGIGNTFSLGCRTAVCAGKSKDAPSEVQHGSFKAEPCTGAGFVEAGRKLLTVTGVGIFLWVVFNVICQSKQFVQFLYG